ncbi:MAG: HD-GYP domain-containing protein [Treponema sp.]|nr:HD-GYP domain-containing protein [Treponema sp.]
MNNFKVKEIPLPSHFSKAAYLDKKFVIAAPEISFNKSLVALLSEWDFTDVYSEGEPSKQSPPPIEVKASQPDPAAVSSHLPDMDRLSSAKRFHISFEKYVRALFDRFSTRNHLDFSFLVGNFKVILDAIRKDYRLILQIQPQTIAKDDDYLVYHTMSTAVIAIVIGDAMKFSDQWLMELGIAALLHEIGMLRLPPESYLGKRELTQEERKLIYIHPIIGYNFLKSFDFPPAVSRAVLEHHERENGSGYPKQKTSENIHLYSKIIAVACSYSAISAARPHREAVDSHTGMMELLKNEGKQYNEKVIRALVSSLSVFPIGLYVMLSDGRKGQVVDINPKKPYYPVVQILGETNLDGTVRILKTSEDGVSVVRALSPKEVEG